MSQPTTVDLARQETQQSRHVQLGLYDPCDDVEPISVVGGPLQMLGEERLQSVIEAFNEWAVEGKSPYCLGVFPFSGHEHATVTKTDTKTVVQTAGGATKVTYRVDALLDRARKLLDGDDLSRFIAACLCRIAIETFVAQWCVEADVDTLAERDGYRAGLQALNAHGAIDRLQRNRLHRLTKRCCTFVHNKTTTGADPEQIVLDTTQMLSELREARVTDLA